MRNAVRGEGSKTCQHLQKILKWLNHLDNPSERIKQITSIIVEPRVEEITIVLLKSTILINWLLVTEKRGINSK